MTCTECRESFSASVDDALSATERAALEAHLAGCAECRREWQRFFATVDLLHAVQPERAPAGFVDRVVAAARPLPWYRRAARGLLVPWPVKLPLEAAAIVMVAGLAVLIFQRSSELQQMARPPETSVETRGEGVQVSEYMASRDRFAQPVSPAPAPPAVATAQEKNKDAIAPAPKRQDGDALTLQDSHDAQAPRAKADAGRLESAPPPVAQQQADEPALARRQQAVEQQRPVELRAPNAGAAAPSVPSPAGAAAAVAPSPPAAAAAPPLAARRAPSARDRFAEDPSKEADQGARQGLAAGRSERKVEEAESQLKKLSAARTIPANVELRLTVGDRAAAEMMVGTMVERLGGAVVPGAVPGTLEIMVPRDAFPALTADLGRLGTLRTLRQPAELPESVRISLQLAN
jgi:hypothetical protein